MSQINPVGNNPPVQNVARQSLPKAMAADGGRSRIGDKLELSGMSHLLKSLKTDIRTEKVAAIRSQIEAGTYEDDSKLDVAVGRLLDDLGKDMGSAA